MIEEEKNSFSELYEKEEIIDQESVVTLRPKDLSDYVGQDRVVEALKIAIEAALQRQEPLEHIIFNGPPGLGKTTLAHIVAHEMGTRIITSSGPALEKGGDLMGLLTHLEKGDIFFIDEIHRIPKVVEEFLYPAMEDFASILFLTRAYMPVLIVTDLSSLPSSARQRDQAFFHHLSENVLVL